MKHRIILGDCRQVLKSLPDSSVNLVVTSPPYNVGIGYGNWKDSIELQDYLLFTREWLAECYRVLTDDGRICVNVPTASYKENAVDMFRFHAIMQDTGFKDREVIIWVKKRNSDRRFVIRQRIYGTWNPVNPMLRNPTEAILIMNKKQDKLHGEARSDLSAREFLDWSYTIWEMDTEMDRTHPAPYPLELPKRLIKLYSFPEQMVLDPFLGSGTTMKACMELGRNSIGIELNPEYVEMVKQKIGYNSVSIEGGNEIRQKEAKPKGESCRLSRMRIP